MANRNCMLPVVSTEDELAEKGLTRRRENHVFQKKEVR